MAHRLIRNTSRETAFSPSSPKVQFSVNELVREATTLEAFARRHWLSTQNRPGLSEAGKRLPSDFLDQLKSLIESLGEVQTSYKRLVDVEPIPKESIDRGRFLLAELAAFVSWYEETEENNIGILQVIARVEAANINDLDSPHALSYALYNYATVTKDILEINGPTGGITNALVEASLALASQLVDAGRSPKRMTEEVLSLAALRRRLVFLLQKKVSYLMSSIRFVFRHHPAILREAEDKRASRPPLTSFHACRRNPKPMAKRLKKSPLPPSLTKGAEIIDTVKIS